MSTIIFGMCLGHFVGRVHRDGPYLVQRDRTIWLALAGIAVFGPIAVWEFINV